MNSIVESVRAKVAAHGLAHVVAARLAAEGYKFAELRLPEMLQVLGTKIYQKSAEYRRIADGLAALQQLREKKV